MKAEKNRQKAEQSFLKAAHSQLQEAAQQRREEKKKAEKEKMMNEDNPDKTRKWEVWYLHEDSIFANGFNGLFANQTFQ